MGLRQQGRAAPPGTPGEVIRTSRWPAEGRGACPPWGRDQGLGSRARVDCMTAVTHTHTHTHTQRPRALKTSPGHVLSWLELGVPRVPACLPLTSSKAHPMPQALSSGYKDCADCKDCAGYKNGPASDAQSPGSLQDCVTLGFPVGRDQVPPETPELHDCGLDCCRHICYDPFLSLPWALSRTPFPRLT